MTNFGVNKLNVERVFELIKEYRTNIYSLRSKLNRGDYVPEQPLSMSDEKYEVFQLRGKTRMESEIARLMVKLEAVVEEALKRIDLPLDVTVTVNRFGRIRMEATCPSCSQTVDLIECLYREEAEAGLRCTNCGAQKVIPLG